MARFYIALTLLSNVKVALFSESLKWIGRTYESVTPIYLGDEWTADCRLSNPNITVELKNKWVDFKHPNIQKHVRKKGQQITMYNLIVELSGTYCCHAKEQKKCLTNLQVQPFKENYTMIVEIDKPNKATLNYFDTLTVNCKSKYDGSINWFNSSAMAKLETDCNDERKCVFQSKGHFFDRDVGPLFLYTRLVIRNATKQTAGKYSCEKTDKLRNTKTVQIEIDVSGPKPATISWSSSNQSINTGKDVELYCMAQGSPKPTITWFNRDVKKLSWCTRSQDNRCYKKNNNTQHDITNTTLIIKNVSYTLDHGLYTCDAQNIFGKENKTIFLTIQVKPQIIRKQESRNCEPKSDGSCELTCEVQLSVPQPNITWSYQPNKCINTSCIPNVRAWEVPSADVGRYNLTPTRMEKDSYRSRFIVDPSIRSGFFQCYAVNVIGDDRLIFRITRDAQDIQVRSNTNPSADTQWYIFSGIVFLLFVVIFIACCKLFQNKKRYGRFRIIDDPIIKLDPKKLITDQTDKLWYDYQWEFPSKGIHFEYELGSGEFGEVHLAEANGVIVPNSKGRLRLKYISNCNGFNKKGERCRMTSKVAVKKLKHDATVAECKDLVSELKILIHIGWHENVVNLLGACTKVTTQHGVDVWIILEYCPYGSVLKVLRSRREMFRYVQHPKTSNTESELTLADLLKWANQVAEGMEFLASRKCIHRDLAARNVLIGSKFTAKVADFGMARDIYKTMRYINATSMVPFKWTAIEVLQDGTSNFKSDVWSYGIFLWELFTLGGEPYPHLSSNAAVTDYLNSGQRLPKPTHCPFEIYTIMTECWQQEPNKRPSFTDLVKKISDFQNNIKQSNEDSEKFENVEFAKSSPVAHGRAKEAKTYEEHPYLNPCFNNNEHRYQNQKQANVTLNPGKEECTKLLITGEQNPSDACASSNLSAW